MICDIYLGLGSNLGDRQRNIEKALERLNEVFGRPYSALSSIVETEPWGFASKRMFLNTCVLYETETPLGPQDLLKACKRIERALGRRAQGGGYEDRPIDIDILLYGTERIDTENLTVPHRLMAQRPFVMEPLQEIVKEETKRAFPEIFD